MGADVTYIHSQGTVGFGPFPGYARRGDYYGVTPRTLSQTTYEKSGQHISFSMLPSLGGGSTLRGFNSWRFRDRNSLFLRRAL